MSSIDKVRKEGTHESLGQVVVVDMMEDRQLRSKEKLEGMAGGRLVKQVHEDDTVGRRPGGRSKKRWNENFKYANWTLLYRPLYRTY